MSKRRREFFAKHIKPIAQRCDNSPVTPLTAINLRPQQQHNSSSSSDHFTMQQLNHYQIDSILAAAAFEKFPPLRDLVSSGRLFTALCREKCFDFCRKPFTGNIILTETRISCSCSERERERWIQFSPPLIRGLKKISLYS